MRVVFIFYVNKCELQWRWGRSKTEMQQLKNNVGVSENKEEKKSDNSSQRR